MLTAVGLVFLGQARRTKPRLTDWPGQASILGMPTPLLPHQLRFFLPQMCGLWILVVLVGCSGAQVGTARSAGPKTVELDAIHLKAKDGKVFVRNFDETSTEADDHLKASQWQEAYDRFAFLIQEFPDHPSIGAVHYNAGLCLLHLNRPAEAAPRFVAAWHKMAGSRDARDALFLAAEAQERAGLWADAAETYRLALQDPATQTEIGGALGLLDEMEARARCGIAFRKLGDPKKADEQFKLVERLYGRHKDVAVVAESEWLARALFERGEIYRELFASIRFSLPVERMKRDLEEKAQLFLKAESGYLHCVKLHHKQWSLQAGYEIGNLYQRLIEDIENAEIPKDLQEMPEPNRSWTLDLYRDELWNHTEKLAKRSIIIYRKNMELAESLGQGSSEWSRRSEDGARRMQAMIDANNARRLRLQTEAPPPDLPAAPATGTPTTAPAPLPADKVRP